MIFFWPGVLAAASQNKVHLVGPIVALIVLVNDRFVTVQFQPAADSQHVAGIAVDVHVFGIQGTPHQLFWPCHVLLVDVLRCREASYSLTMPLPLAEVARERRRVVTCPRRVPYFGDAAQYGAGFEHGGVGAVDVLALLPGLALTNAVTACSRSVFVSATGTVIPPGAMPCPRHARRRPWRHRTRAGKWKSTSHSQLMSRPSAYSSLMAIMVSALAGSKLASERRKPIGFLTSSSSTGEPLTSMTSPRPKAGVTRETARR